MGQIIKPPKPTPKPFTPKPVPLPDPKTLPKSKPKPKHVVSPPPKPRPIGSPMTHQERKCAKELLAICRGSIARARDVLAQTEKGKPTAEEIRRWGWESKVQAAKEWASWQKDIYIPRNLSALVMLYEMSEKKELPTLLDVKSLRKAVKQAVKKLPKKPAGQ
jgi:hypothetical protein